MYCHHRASQGQGLRPYNAAYAQENNVNKTYELHPNQGNMNLFNNHNVEYIFTGHLHINLETKFNDTKIISTSAVGVPLGDDPSGYRIIDFVNENLSYKFYEI